MPCVAKKAEAARSELTKDDNNNVDIVITTREFGAMLKETGLDFAGLPESDFDKMMGESEYRSRCDFWHHRRSD
jgi:NADH-quinone oxidoreductase subunit G